MKKLKTALLFIALLIMTCSMTTQAATKTVTNVTTLKQNTWTAKKYSEYNASTSTFTYYMYKIVIPSDGYISITGSKDADKYIRLYTNTKDNYTGSVLTTVNSNTAIDKGTYYVYGARNYSFKYKFTKAVNSSNYCMAKAAALASGKKVTVCNTSNYYYDRWYKVVLKKKQKINLYISQGDGSYIQIVNNKMDTYSMANKGTHYYTKETLAKGTYYIRVRALYDPLTIFYWK